MPEKTNKSVNCYSCTHRGSVPGSAHSCCNHPDNKEMLDDPMCQMMAIFASVKRVAPIVNPAKSLKVKLNDYGVKNGWANFPWNFDPIWVEWCEGYVPDESDGKRLLEEAKSREGRASSDS